jgi:BolA protein
MPPLSRATRIAHLLTTAFSPDRLEVQDDSAKHAGHSGAAPGGETHFTVRMISQRFIGLTRVARSRAVHQALAGEFESGLHALSLELHAPENAPENVPKPAPDEALSKIS